MMHITTEFITSCSYNSAQIFHLGISLRKVHYVQQDTFFSILATNVSRKHFAK